MHAEHHKQRCCRLPNSCPPRGTHLQSPSPPQSRSRRRHLCSSAEQRVVVCAGRVRWSVLHRCCSVGTQSIARPLRYSPKPTPGPVNVLPPICAICCC